MHEWIAWDDGPRRVERDPHRYWADLLVEIGARYRVTRGEYTNRRGESVRVTIITPRPTP